MLRVIERQRNGETLNPSNIKEVAIPVQLQVTEKSDQILAYDCGPDEEDRVLIFATETNLDILETSQEWHADGTFKVFPQLFYQIYSEHAVYNEHTVPLVFMLLTCKSAAVYEKAFRALKELNPDLSPKRVITDFELAAINSFRKTFPTTEVKGVSFILHKQFGGRFRILDLPVFTRRMTRSEK